MKTKHAFYIVLIFIFLAIQFLGMPSNIRTVSISENDFFYEMDAETPIKTLIKSSCYDCHSNETKYPWYAYIAPVSFMTNHHIKEGKEHLNFSEWENLEYEKQMHKLEECIEEIEEREMPLEMYTYTHPEANWTDKQREEVIAYFNSRKQK